MIANLEALKVILPTHRYLKKFMDTEVGVSPDFTLTTENLYGLFLYNLLGHAQWKNGIRTTYNDQIKIIIPPGYVTHNKHELTDSDIDYYNTFLYNQFNNEFINQMKLCDMFGLRHDKSIELFCARYKIELEVDITYEALKKRYQRYRQLHGEPRKKFIIDYKKYA